MPPGLAPPGGPASPGPVGRPGGAMDSRTGGIVVDVARRDFAYWRMASLMR